MCELLCTFYSATKLEAMDNVEMLHESDLEPGDGANKESCLKCISCGISFLVDSILKNDKYLLEGDRCRNECINVDLQR